MGLLDDLALVFSVGPDPIPRYVWEPIARQESGLNPSALAVTPSEYSVGLFQINLAAHPELARYDLTNPIVNAQIARTQFIGPAWSQAKATFTDPGAQAAYVWRYGIKPNWAQVQARGADRELMSDANSLASLGGAAGVAQAAPGALPAGDSVMSPGFWAKSGLSILWVVALILLALLGIYGATKSFGVDSPGKGAFNLMKGTVLGGGI